MLFRDLGGDDDYADKEENPLQLSWDRSWQNSVENRKCCEARGRKGIYPTSSQKTQKRRECPADDRPIIPVHAVSKSGIG
jgi:hypothetical protein